MEFEFDMIDGAPVLPRRVEGFWLLGHRKPDRKPCTSFLAATLRCGMSSTTSASPASRPRSWRRTSDSPPAAHIPFLGEHEPAGRPGRRHQARFVGKVRLVDRPRIAEVDSYLTGGSAPPPGLGVHPSGDEYGDTTGLEGRSSGGLLPVARLTVPNALQELVTAAVLFLPRLGVSILTFVGFWVAAAVLQAILGRFGERTHVGPEVVRLAQRMAKTGLLVFGSRHDRHQRLRAGRRARPH